MTCLTPARQSRREYLMQPTIEAWDVHKGFGTGSAWRSILGGVSLTVARGETVYLVGRSGSGKTTLLSILGCILTPDRGRVRILGQDPAQLNVAQRAAFRGRNLGFIFQSFNLFPTLSALDNIVLALSAQGVGRKAAVFQAETLLEQVGLGPRLRVRPPQLSTGECQRVAIARALAGNPEVIFADEPTASLDAENGQVVLQLLTRMVRARGVSLVVVTHDNRIFPFADRILELEDGRLKQEQAPHTGAQRRSMMKGLVA